ncbi:MAG: hypothetical protein IJY61_08750 [Candidatus Gastranaerophilales bacterium]|nr:hypothetical protein [Candidatus Gastranaerophilales bacterium]
MTQNRSNVHSDNNVSMRNNKQIEFLPNNYYSPISFCSKQRTRVYSSQYPELFEHPGDFQLAKIDGIPCPACGKKMMTRQKFEEFKQRLDETNPNQYLYLLGEYQDYMRPIEASVYQELLALSSTAETTDIRELLVTLRQTKLPQLQSIQRRKLIQMKKIARTLPSEERAALSMKLTELGKQIKRKNEEAPFRRKKMLQEIKNVKISNPYKYEKLQNLAKAFPTSKDTNSAWIIKYSGKNKHNQDWESKDIAERMLYSSVPNIDHIIPYGTERGHDDISNYLSMHSGCNCIKGSKPFVQWYNEMPDVRNKSLNAYFDRAEELISQGAIKDDKYEKYVAYATETIRDVTKGQVSLRPMIDELSTFDNATFEIDDKNIDIAVDQ